MKFLLTMNLPYTRAHGGANRSNRALSEALVKRGHQVRIVVPALATPSPITYDQFLEDLKVRGATILSQKEGQVAFKLNGVDVHAVKEPSRLRACLIEQLNLFTPDWTLVSSEDPSQSLLDAALKLYPQRVVYL